MNALFNLFPWLLNTKQRYLRLVKEYATPARSRQVKSGRLPWNPAPTSQWISSGKGHQAFFDQSHRQGHHFGSKPQLYNTLPLDNLLTCRLSLRAASDTVVCWLYCISSIHYPSRDWFTTTDGTDRGGGLAPNHRPASTLDSTKRDQAVPLRLIAAPGSHSSSL